MEENIYKSMTRNRQNKAIVGRIDQAFVGKSKEY